MDAIRIGRLGAMDGGYRRDMLPPLGRFLEAEALAEALSGIGAQVVYLFEGRLIDVTVQTRAGRKTCEHFMRAKGLVVEACRLFSLSPRESVYQFTLAGLEVHVSGRE